MLPALPSCEQLLRAQDQALCPCSCSQVADASLRVLRQGAHDFQALHVHAFTTDLCIASSPVCCGLVGTAHGTRRAVTVWLSTSS